MDGAEVGVLEETDEVSLGCLLEGEDGGGLEPEVAGGGFEVLGDLADEALEGDLADQQVSGPLVFPDLLQGDGTGPVAAGLLDAGMGWVLLPRRLGSELTPRGLTSGGLSGRLLGTSHVVLC